MEKPTPAQIRGLKIRCKLMQAILEFPGSTVYDLVHNSGVNLSKRQVQRHLFTLLSEDLVRVENGKFYLSNIALKIFQGQIAYICKQGIKNFQFLSAHYRGKHG